MYPDWIIDNVMIELFGATHLKRYEEKIEYKKNNYKQNIVWVSKEDYENGNWERRLRNWFKNYF